MYNAVNNQFICDDGFYSVPRKDEEIEIFGILYRVGAVKWIITPASFTFSENSPEPTVKLFLHKIYT